MENPQPVDLLCMQIVELFTAECNLKRKPHRPAAVFCLTTAAVGERTPWPSPLSPSHTLVNRKKKLKELSCNLYQTDT